MPKRYASFCCNFTWASFAIILEVMLSFIKQKLTQAIPCQQKLMPSELLLTMQMLLSLQGEKMLGFVDCQGRCKCCN